MKESSMTADGLVADRAEPATTARGGQNNIVTIAMRELRSYFDSLVAYVVLGGTLLGVGIFFFLFQGGFWQVDRATMFRLFDYLARWFVPLLVIPLITMRALAEEKRSGTIELLITMPVTDAEVILGKYFAALLMVIILLAASLLYPIAIFVWPWHLGALDWGPIWTAYLGLLLYSAAGVSVGMLFSSLTESQVIAFFLTFCTMGFMTIIGTVAEFLPESVGGDVLGFVSFSSRYTPFAQGLIDTRCVVYFISVAIICLLAAFRSLESRKWK